MVPKFKTFQGKLRVFGRFISLEALLSEGKVMKEKVLLIDDDEALLDLMKMGLKREGFEVFTAEDGQEGLRIAYTSSQM